MAEEPFSQARVLVVEDNLTSANIVGYLLQSIGLSPTFASNGEEAVQIAGSEPFDLILMDLHMPGINGVEAAQEIQEGPSANESTPIVALTAHACEKYRTACEKAGMKGFLIKPATARDLTNVLTDVLPGQTTNCAEGALDHDAIAQMTSVMSEENFQNIVSVCLDDIANRVNIICGADLTRDVDMVAKHSHDIKSTSGQIGACGVLSLATEINCKCKEAQGTAHPAELGHLQDLLRQLADEFTAAEKNLKSAYFSGADGVSPAP